MATVMTTDETRRGRNERRAARMNVWIDLARKTSDDDDCAHVRFVFYWIAYEAAYKVDDSGPSSSRASEAQQRRSFHRNIAGYDRGRLRETLCRHRERVAKVLELRQAHPSFWQKWDEDGWVERAEDWERIFRERTDKAKKTLRGAIEDWHLGGANKRTANSLNDLFDNLAIVRHQIVHGASAGSHSRGRTQVRLGAQLLHALIPCFRDSITSNLDEDWGRPPFPHVGAAADDECPPPWLTPNPTDAGGP